MRGYFGIGIINGKCEANVGILWRTAHIMGAQFIFTIGSRYKKQPTDTMQTTRHVPCYQYENWEHFKKTVPQSCQIVAIELDVKSVPMQTFKHPERAIYLLGAENSGVPADILTQCDHIVQLPGENCLNVSVAGSMTIYDRYIKSLKQ